MSLAITRPSSSAPFRAAWRALDDRQPALARAALAFAGLGVLAVLATFIDPRTLNGLDIWVKPAKFFVSAAVYLATLAWFFPLLGRHARSWFGRGVAALSIAGMTIELAIISLQSARGVGSHFNTATAFDGMLFSIMGMTILVATLAMPAMAVVIAFTRSTALPAWRWAVVIGLLVAYAGGLEGMAIATHGGHWVGGTASDGGNLAPFFWSRDGGDLRVAHFFGLHAMQAIPLIGAAAAALLPPRAAVPAMLAGAATYTGCAAWTFLAALDGRPLL